MTHSINDITSNIGPSPNRQQEKDLAEIHGIHKWKKQTFYKKHIFISIRFIFIF